jgi:predicted RNA binding protein YcfA (HicA-like mRNA interferase family)
MRKLPRDLSGSELAALLGRLGFAITRQSGSHLILTTQQRGEFHVCVPLHQTISVGTLSDLLSDIAGHLGVSKRELRQMLFER